METSKVIIVEKGRNIVLEYWNNNHVCKVDVLDIHYTGERETTNYIELNFYTAKSLSNNLFKVIYSKISRKFILREYELVNEYNVD